MLRCFNIIRKGEGRRIGTEAPRRLSQDGNVLHEQAESRKRELLEISKRPNLYEQLAAALEVAAKAGDAPDCARLLPNVLSACERAAVAAAATGTSAAEWKSRPAPTPQQPDA